MASDESKPLFDVNVDGEEEEWIHESTDNVVQQKTGRRKTLANQPAKGTIRLTSFGNRRRFNGKHWKRLCRRSDCNTEATTKYTLCSRHYTQFEAEEDTVDIDEWCRREAIASSLVSDGNDMRQIEEEFKMNGVYEISDNFITDPLIDDRMTQSIAPEIVAIQTSVDSTAEDQQMISLDIEEEELIPEITDNVGQQRRKRRKVLANPTKGTIRMTSFGNRKRFNGKQWKRLCRRSDCNTGASTKYTLCTRHYTQFEAADDIDIDEWCRREANDITHIEQEIDDSTAADNPKRFDGSSLKQLCHQNGCDKAIRNSGLCQRHLMERNATQKDNRSDYITRTDLLFDEQTTQSLTTAQSSDVSIASNKPLKGTIMRKNGIRRRFNGTEWRCLCRQSGCDREGKQKHGLCARHLRQFNAKLIPPSLQNRYKSQKPMANKSTDSVIRVNDIFHELTDENKRLLNELIFADKYINALTQYKCFVDSVSDKLKPNLESNELKNYEILYRNVKQLSDENERHSKKNSLNNNTKNIDLRHKKTINTKVIECQENCDSNDSQMNESNDSETQLPYEALAGHQAVHRSESVRLRLSCDHPNCRYTTYSAKWLALHRTRKHCTFVGCDYTSTHNSNMKNHILRHHSTDRPFRCTHSACDKAYITREDLERHVQAIHAEKTIRCDWPGCDYKTWLPKLLEEHRTLHSEERTVLCHWPGCDKRYKYKSSLRLHVKSAHTNHRPYACHWPGCEYKAVAKEYLDDHFTQHSQERRFECSQCHMKFKTKSNLKSHLLTHKGDKKFLCQWPGCDYKCITNAMLKLHMNTHKSKG